jgi:hypothetical protein
MRSLRCLVRPTSVGVRAHRFARSRQAGGEASSHRNQLPQGAAAWGMGVVMNDGSTTVTSYHNLRYCSKSLRGIRVGRAGRAEGWIMDGWIVVCK